MPRPIRQVFRLSATAAALIWCGQAQADSRLQQVADDAALAAVEVLATGGATADAVAIAQQTIAAMPGIAAEVTASPDLVVRVELSAIDTKNKVNSTARYVPPDQPSTFAWASRQRFAVKPLPYTVGSACLRDCEPNRLR